MTLFLDVTYSMMWMKSVSLHRIERNILGDFDHCFQRVLDDTMVPFAQVLDWKAPLLLGN